MNRPVSALRKSVPVIVASGLLLSACGSGSGSVVASAPAPAAASVENAASAPASGAAETKGVAPAAAPAQSATAVAAAKSTTVTTSSSTHATKAEAGAHKAAAPAPAAVAGPAKPAVKAVAAKVSAEDQKAYDASNGATDVGVTKDSIKLGSVSMHGMALGNVLVLPVVRGNLGTISAINDRGGVLGRRLTLTDCDDGPGEVSRAKACIKKLAGEDKVFSLVSAIDWATASIHDDLSQMQMPYVGVWAYSQTEWQDPFMFPTHMSMIHEAMAGAHWAADTIKPKTYGMICLTSPEMQLACNEVQKIVDASGAKMVKRADVSISETSMSAYVLAFRAANPEHIIHYVINPATMVKFMVEAQQQGYYPPKGMSGNHLAAEVLGSLFGQWPVNRYWTNTTYKLWGPEFIATMNKYARGNRGTNHHIVQAGYTGINIFAQAARQVVPNLTRKKLMAQLGNGTVWQADSSLDQRFSYVPSERNGSSWSHENGQGREFMYKYTSTNTVSNPDGSPVGFDPAENFVIHTDK